MLFLSYNLDNDIVNHILQILEIYLMFICDTSEHVARQFKRFDGQDYQLQLLFTREKNPPIYKNFTFCIQIKKQT